MIYNYLPKPRVLSDVFSLSRLLSLFSQGSSPTTSCRSNSPRFFLPYPRKQFKRKKFLFSFGFESYSTNLWRLLRWRQFPRFQKLDPGFCVITLGNEFLPPFHFLVISLNAQSPDYHFHLNYRKLRTTWECPEVEVDLVPYSHAQRRASLSGLSSGSESYPHIGSIEQVCDVRMVPSSSGCIRAPMTSCSDSFQVCPRKTSTSLSVSLSLSLISNILFFSFYSLCFSIFEDSIDISSSSEIPSSDGSSLSASPSVAFFIFCYIEIFSSSEILSSAGSSLSASASVAFFISCYSIFDPYHFFLVLFQDFLENLSTYIAVYSCMLSSLSIRALLTLSIDHSCLKFLV